MRRRTSWIVLGLVLSASLAQAQVVISEFRVRGPNGGNDEFVELYNNSDAPVNIGGWKIRGSNVSGTIGDRATIPAGTTIPARGHFLATNSSTSAGPYSGTVPGDVTYTTGIADDGGIAVTLPDNTIVDQVGMSSGSAFKEGTPLTNLGTSNLNRSYERKPGGSAGSTQDTGNNSADFALISPSDPQNLSSPPTPAGGEPVLSISDVSANEGDSGETHFDFVVSLNVPATTTVTFTYATADGTATVADGDYVAKSGTGTIAFGEQTYTIRVIVNGDTKVESHETFSVDLSAVTGAEVSKSQGTGTIINDDIPPTIYEVSISQIYGGGGNSGATYTHDFVELFNRGTTSVSLTGWSVQYSPAGGGTWSVAPLSGSIAPGAYYLVRLAAGNSCSGSTPCGDPLPVAHDASGNLNLATTSGRVALSSSTAAFTGGSCPTGSPLVDLVGYGSATCFEGSAAASGPANNGSAAYRKRGGCVDSNDNRADFLAAAPSPRSSASPSRSCGYEPAAIHQIQGDGLVTPYLDRDVTTTGIVTARKTNGFFLQTPDAGADSDPNTSQGIFVFTSTAPTVAVGDFVTVKGTATEFFDLTQISSTLEGDVEYVSGGHALPAPVTLTAAILDANGTGTQLERFEGMRVHAPSLVSVAPTNNFGETYTVLAGVPRPMREPGIESHLPVPPDPMTGLVDCCIPRWDRNPERIMIDSDGLAGAPFLNVTSNVPLSDVTGPLDFSFGDYKILPEVPPTAGANMTAVAVPAPQPGDFTVASFNIEHFSNNDTQRRKAALAIREVLHLPDVLGHVEIASLAALEALAAQVNNDVVAAGGANPGYEARLIPFGAGTQHVGFLIKTSRVRIDDLEQEPAGTYIRPDNGLPALLHDRPPLVLRATVDPGTERRRAVILVVVHNRSFIDIELVGGEGPRVRAKRTAQAEDLAKILQRLQTANPATPVIALGDYNAFHFNDGHTDPIAVIKGTPTPTEQVVVQQSPDLVDPDFVNLTDSLPAHEQYTFVYEGTPQALDHVLVNSAVTGYVKHYAIGRANADFPAVPASLYAADVTRPERSSDHDIPVAAFRFPAMSAVTADPAVLWPVDGRMVEVNVSYQVWDRCGTVTKTLAVSSNEPSGGAPDWQIVDAHRLRLRADRLGTGTGRIYTITATATDSCGLATTDTVTVTVPHDQRR